MEKNYLDIVNKRKQIEIANIKKCNEYTNQYGLILSENQISNLLERRKETLKETGRIEFREGIIDKLIKEYLSSIYLENQFCIKFSEEKIKYLLLMLQNKDKSEIEDIINQVYKEICKELISDNKELQTYIKKNLSSVVEIITNTVKQKTLDKIFIPQKFVEY